MKRPLSRLRLTPRGRLRRNVVLLLLLPTGESRPPAEEERADREAFFQLEELEEKLARTLSGIHGAGETEVMLTLKSGSRQVLAQDTQSRGRGAQRLHRDPGAWLRQSGGGPAPDRGPPVPRGAGGVRRRDDPGVRLQVIRAVSALTGLGSDCITVCQGDP